MASERLRSTNSVARAQVLGFCALLVAITWLVFGETVRYDFVDYDDNEYVYANPNITKGLTVDGVTHAFVARHAGNWHPLTTLSHMLDCQLWGLHAGGHHFTNIVLHTIAVVLLFLVLYKMTGGVWRSAFVAAIFAIHPLRVESVAWISERKDVLSAVFFMLTLGAYVHYARSASLGRYLTMSILFALGLMCKPMLVTLPFVLLLLDYWPLGRWPSTKASGYWPTVRGLVLEKVPLLLLSLGSGLATIWAQQRGVAPLQQLPLISRITNGLVACVIYLKQMFWPVRLAVFYPHLENKLPIWEIGFAFALITLVSGCAIALHRKCPYVLTGWFWYLLMLLPVIGLVQVGSQAHADRYTYLPQIGICILLSWTLAAALASQLQRRIAAVAASLVLVVFGWRAHIQTSYWRNGESLWRHALAVTSGNFMAHDGVGVSLLSQGRLDEAITQFQTALKIAPRFSPAETNLSIALIREGRVDDAIPHLQRLVKEYPDDAQAYYQLANALLKKKDSRGAIEAYGKALSFQTQYPAAHYNFGIALDRSGRIDEAIAHYQKATEQDPHYAEAYYLLGNDLVRTGRVDDAIAAYEHALKNRPAYPEVENGIGLALFQKGRPSEGIVHWQNALTAQPDSVDSLNNLAWVLATFPDTWIRNGRRALTLADRANQLSADKNPAVLRTLAAAYAENGRFTEARVTAERGLQLANAQDNPALAKIFEGDLALYRVNAPVRTAARPQNSLSP